MPELPEVETIVNDLKKVLPGLKIQDVWIDVPKMIKAPQNFSDFKKELQDKKILNAERKGKNILIHLSVTPKRNKISNGAGKTLLIHQKLTGHLLYGIWNLESGIWKSAMAGPLRDDPQNRFIHLILFLSNKKQLALSDVRKFAKVLIWPTDKLKDLEDIKKLGPDPLDKNFTFKKFSEIIKAKKGKIKQVLMDQNIISGIGNIYSDEILWQAGIHPFKPAQNLKNAELKKIYKSTKEILKKAIEARGSSNVDYRDILGKKGKYQEIRSVYQREGEKCRKNDGGIIKRIKIGGRSAHFCPVHQKI